MKILRLPGIIITLVGSILIGICGLMILFGAAVSAVFSGISYLILGVGLLLFMLFLLLGKEKTTT